MVSMMMHQQHQNPVNPPPIAVNSNTIRSPFDTPSKILLSDILPYDGAPASSYLKAVDTLSSSLNRHNAVIIDLGPNDAALFRCALEATRVYFQARKTRRGVYTYRAGRPLGDVDASPPCMSDIFRCMGKVARAALSAIARNLRLRSDVFNHLLDDSPLAANEASSSVLVATSSQLLSQGGKGTSGGNKLASTDTEKGLLMLISADAPGLQVCDPSGHWYLADSCLAPGELLLITGKALSHATAGLRPAVSYRAAPDYILTNASGGRTSLAFKLMPQCNAILDCTPISAAGHVIPQSYVPISVSQFLDNLAAVEDELCSHTDTAYVPEDNPIKEPSLRSVLSDPLSGAFLEDAVFVSCGHSFGGAMLRRVIETSKCTVCSTDIDPGSMIPNYALRAAAIAVKQEDDRRLFHNASLRKRRKEGSEHRDNGDIAQGEDSYRAIQYPFSVSEKVIIKGNRRTPDKFVGKEAVITSQCLNGWYLLTIIESGETIRLQYRSLKKISTSHDSENRSISQPVQDSSS